VAHVREPFLLTDDVVAGHRAVADELPQELGRLLATRVELPVDPALLVQVGRDQVQWDTGAILEQEGAGIDDLGLPGDPIPRVLPLAVVDRTLHLVFHQLPVRRPRLLAVLPDHAQGEPESEDGQIHNAATHDVLLWSSATRGYFLWPCG